MSRPRIGIFGRRVADKMLLCQSACALLLPRISELRIRQLELAPAKQFDSLDEAASRVAHLFVKILHLIEVIVACRIRLAANSFLASATLGIPFRIFSFAIDAPPLQHIC